MDDTRALPLQIQQALARGWIVLTANQRAARTLRHAFDLHQRALGNATWEPPAVLAWDAWLSSLWHRLLLEGRASELLLNSTQEHTLWQATITADPAISSLRPIDALAQTAADAWSLLHAYRGRPHLSRYPGNADTRTFERWAAEFERRCTRARYLTQAQLPETLRAAFAEGRLGPATSPSPAGILLVGFDRKTLAQEALLEAVSDAGVTVEEVVSAQPATGIALVTAPDEHLELIACARWLRSYLLEHPQSSVAVIHSAIESAQSSIDRVFRRILAPELNDAAAPVRSAPWEFSLGIPLARTPMVGTALDILRWALGPLPLDRVTALLLSPHFAAADADGKPETSNENAEHLARAEFDAFVLRGQHLLRPEFSVNDLYALVSDSRRKGELAWIDLRLRALRSFLNKGHLTGDRSHADWAAIIHDLLEAAGWAPASRDTSIEFQTRRKWESALDELATLDFDGLPVSFKLALSALERIATRTLFAPESRRAPIQIMGPLESADSTFDAIWFLCAGDLSWPTTSTPSPLLPWRLQRELTMPGTDPSLDTAYARSITQRIAASAPTILFSYAKETLDAQQRPTPALTGLSLAERDAATIAPAETAPEIVRLIDVPDAVPMPPSEDHVFNGGAAILQAQAACGFKAFAERRLFSSTVESISLGLDPMERGSLVHDVLEKFWAEVKTQAALKNMTTADRDDVLAHSIDDALARHKLRGADQTWPRAYIDSERQRLLKLLGQWLDYEATRAPFTVKSREEKLEGVKIGPLRLDIRVDRVDQLVVEADSEDDTPAEIIFDYKTGRAAPAQWLGPRPDAPQLPLYAVVAGSPQLDAVAFANLRPGKNMGINGYEARDGILPKSTRLKAESLAAQLAEWREVITSLAEDFHNGMATVSPKRYPQTCNYCEQRLLCRLKLSTLEADALVDQEEPEDPNADSESPSFDPSGPEADFG
jgi:probable DNA repair protein